MDNMKLDDIIALAMANHKKSYNCAQSVICAFHELLQMDEKTLFKITEGLGFGMGNGEGTCGAISAGTVMAGIITSTCDLEHPNSKGATYKKSKEIMDAFKEKNSSVICKDLKGIETGKVLRSCDGCIEDSVRIIYKSMFLKEDK